MAKVVWQGFVLSPTNGKPVSGAEIRVFDADSGLATTLYSDRAGSAWADGNPFFTGPDGFVQFYVDPKRIRVEAYEGSQVAQFDDVLVGTVDDGGIVTANLADGAVTRQKLNFNAVEYVDDVAEMLALSSPVEGQRVSVTEYLADIAGGHAEYYWDATRLKSAHNGSSVISNTVPWDGSASGLNDFQDGVGETDPSGTGCWVSLLEVEKASAWGISPDNPDNLEAVLNFINETQYLPDGAPSSLPSCPPLKFSEGTYDFSAPLDIKARVIFFGTAANKSSSNGGTRFNFINSGDGVRLHRSNTIGNGDVESPATTGADGSIISGLVITGTKTADNTVLMDSDSAAGKYLFNTAGTVSALDEFDLSEIDSANYATDVVDTVSVSSVDGSDGKILPICTLTGSFSNGETITGGTSGATATVLFVSPSYSALVINNRTGTFVVGETVTGGTSGATASVFQSLQGLTVTVASGSDGGLLSDGTQYLCRAAGEFGSGIVQFCAAVIENVKISKFPEHGVKIVTPGVYPQGNANRFRLDSIWVTNVGHHGFFVAGGDSNAGMGLDLNGINCCGYTIYDRSFLGNQWSRAHSSLNLLGAYYSGGNTDRASSFIDCYSEGDQSRSPYPPYASVCDGSSSFWGGTQGAPVNISYEGDLETSSTPLGNTNFNPRVGFNFLGMEYGDKGSSLAGTGLKIKTSGGSGVADALTLKGIGNSGAGRGTAIAFEVPSANNASIPGARIECTGASAFIDFLIKTNNSLGTNATVSDGSGAQIWLDIQGGVIVDAVVLRPGSGYLKTSTITINIPGGDAAGTGAALRPVVNGGRLTGVVIDSGGSGYSDTNPQRVLRISKTDFSPANDNAYALGASSTRYSVVYAGTGTINTSDENEKQQIRTLTEAELAVAQACKGLIRAFKFNDAVERKGDDARIHVGVIAQDVEQAFVDQGLDPSSYAMFCRDTWWEVDGHPASEDDEGAVQMERLGIRYDELLAFIIGAL